MSGLLPYALLIKPTTAKKTKISGKFRASCHSDSQQPLDKPLPLSGSSSPLNNHQPLSCIPHTTLQDQRQHLGFITSWAIQESQEVFVTFPTPHCLYSPTYKKKFFFLNEESQPWPKSLQWTGLLENDTPVSCLRDKSRRTGSLW